MDQGLVIPRYRPDLGIGKSFIDYEGIGKPTFDDTVLTSRDTKMGDHTCVSSSSSQWERPERGGGGIHVRQNFVGKGRSGGYVPPPRGTSGVRMNEALESHRAGKFVVSSPAVDRSPKYEDAGMENEMMFPRDELEPFDSRPHTTQQPTVEHTDPFSFESVNERLKPLITITQQCGREFSIKGPRYSDPSLLVESINHNKPSVDRNQSVNGSSNSANTPVSSYNDIPLRPSQYITRDTTSNSELGEAKERIQMKDSDDPFLGLEIANEVELDFPEENSKPVKVTHKIRRRHPTTARDCAEVEPEDTSDDNMKLTRRSPSNLQERTQQAWRSRRQKNSSLRSKRDPQEPRSTNTVSFKGKDTVQYFEPHVEEVTDDGTDENTDDVNDEVTDETNTSIDERSLNSEYTKGLESEVEDMIKDIFFIGNGATSQPGRRKYKYKHEVKKRLLQKDSIIQEGGASSDRRQKSDKNDAALSLSTKQRGNVDTDMKISGEQQNNQRTIKEKKRNNNVARTSNRDGKTLPDMSEAEAALWNFVEGGMSAVSSALGLALQENEDVSRKQSRESSLSGSACSEPILPFEACAGRIAPSSAFTRPAISDLYDYAQDVVYGPLEQANKTYKLSGMAASHEPSRQRDRVLSPARENTHRSIKSPTEEFPEINHLPFSMDSLDNDPNLTELALHAAKSFHQSRGVEFDESHVICMHEDLQISVVELQLPLGLIFLENDGGCFVTKVAPDGSAARSRGVEVGDQLASINGRSGNGIKVEDICDLIAETPNPNCIEMVFFRYIGPFHPIAKPRMRTDRPGYGQITGYTPPSIGPVSKSANAPNEKKKGFRLFGRAKIPMSK